MTHRMSACALTVLAMTLFPLTGSGADEPVIGAIEILTTPSGERFAILGKKSSKPAPTLVVLATTPEETLQSRAFNSVGHLLGQQGFLCISVDVPCHGKDQQPGEPGGLPGWRSRLEKGKPLVGDFVKKTSRVLGYLIEKGYTDEKNVGACGTSRGAFMAIHFAATEPRVGWVVAFAPVTDLTVLTEFAGLEESKAVRSLSLLHQADNLAGRGFWLCIGNHDLRVGTDQAIALTRRITEATVKVTATAKGTPQAVALTRRRNDLGKGDIIPVELHVMPAAGHSTPTTAHEEAARWALSRAASP